MADNHLVNELARRAGISPERAEAVLRIFGEIAREQLPDRRDPQASAPAIHPPLAFLSLSRTPAASPVGTGDASRPARAPYIPTEREISELIASAATHPLGLEFLVEGDPGAVAATFRTHAFTVDAARAQLAGQRSSRPGEIPERDQGTS